MSYAGLGNFGGDALGGGLAILVEVLATKNMSHGHRYAARVVCMDVQSRVLTYL